MKTLIIILLFPLQIFAQDITGLWTGFIHTTDKDLPYELAISENNGKLSRYSHTIFTVNGVDENGVKALSIKKNNDKVEVENNSIAIYTFSTSCHAAAVHYQKQVTGNRCYKAKRNSSYSGIC